MNPETIDILITYKPWHQLHLETLIIQVIDTVFTFLILDKTINLTVKLTNDQDIQRLNKQFRQKDGPTNVLSFPPPPFPCFEVIKPLGDIVLSYETLTKEALEQGKDFQSHFIHMLVHGLLHLLNYDHQHEDDAHLMETTEKNILTFFDIKDPYEFYE